MSKAGKPLSNVQLKQLKHSKLHNSRLHSNELPLLWQSNSNNLQLQSNDKHKQQK